MIPAAAAWFWLLIVFSINIAAPFLPFSTRFSANAAGFLLTLLYVAAVVGFALAVARGRLRIRYALAFALLSAVFWLLADKVLTPPVAHAFRAMRQMHAKPTQAQLFQYFSIQTIKDVSLMSGAAFTGAALARMVRHANMLVPICVGIALIDIWGVLFGGIVSQLMTNKATAHIAKQAMTQGPQSGVAAAISAAAGKPMFSAPLPAIGIGDFLFAALLLSIIVNLAMNWQTSSRLMFFLVSATLLSITFLHIRALPGLVPIGLGALLPNLKYSKYTREEKFALLYAGILVVVLTTALYYGFKHALPDPKVMG